MIDLHVPIFLRILFLLALICPIYMIANLARTNAQPHDKKGVFYGILFFYLTYLLVVAIACFNGAFNEISIPPKIVLLTTLPLLLFLLGFVFNTKFFKSILRATPLYALIRLHIFRLIGSFFLILFSLNLLPFGFAMFAGFGDLITAISSVFVAKYVQQNESFSKPIVLTWNTFGLLDIFGTSALAIVYTKMSIETGLAGVEVLTTFPFCFIPAFAPATIIFLHLSIYKRLFMS